MLRDSFKLLLSHRKAWNVQRLYWFLWRDPPASQGAAGAASAAARGS